MLCANTRTKQSISAFLCNRLEDLITPDYLSCLVIILLTDQIVTFIQLSYFERFGFYIWVVFMPEIRRQCNNKFTATISKHCVLFQSPFPYFICRNYDGICKIKSSISNYQLSDPIWDNIDKGMTLCRLIKLKRRQLRLMKMLTRAFERTYISYQNCLIICFSIN